jgi:hypothetical protein
MASSVAIAAPTLPSSAISPPSRCWTSRPTSAARRATSWGDKLVAQIGPLLFGRHGCRLSGPASYRQAALRPDLASIPPRQDSSDKRHLRVVKVELLIFGSALRFVGSGNGLHSGQPAISGSEHIAGSLIHHRPP